MTARFFLACLLLVATTSSRADSPTDSDTTKECDGSGGQAGDLGCELEIHQTLDTRLNAVYKQLRSKLGGNERRLLIKAQRAWLNYMKADCASQLAASEREPEDEGATFHMTLSIENAACENEHIKARLKILNALNHDTP